MTTIAYRDGIMAADSRAYSGNRDYMGAKAKIERLEDGTLIGVSSTVVGGGEEVREWVKAGTNPKAELNKGFTLLLVKPDGKVFVAVDTTLLSGPLTADFFAVGTGSDIALGAMGMGATAIKAVEVGCRLDPWSALPIYAGNHSGKMPMLLVDLPLEMFHWLS